MEAEQDFLTAIAKGKHRRGAGARLRKIIAKREHQQYGRLACFCCGRVITVNTSTIEHILPQSLGGTWGIDNLALSHSECNAKRNNTPTPRFTVV